MPYTRTQPCTHAAWPEQLRGAIFRRSRLPQWRADRLWDSVRLYAACRLWRRGPPTPRPSPLPPPSPPPTPISFHAVPASAPDPLSQCGPVRPMMLIVGCSRRTYVACLPAPLGSTQNTYCGRLAKAPMITLNPLFRLCLYASHLMCTLASRWPSRLALQRDTTQPLPQRPVCSGRCRQCLCLLRTQSLYMVNGVGLLAWI